MSMLPLSVLREVEAGKDQLPRIDPFPVLMISCAVKSRLSIPVIEPWSAERLMCQVSNQRSGQISMSRFAVQMLVWPNC